MGTGAGIAAGLGAGAGAGWAQDGFGPFTGYPTAAELAQPQIVTLDPERLFLESAFGRRVGAEIESRSRRLSDENRALEAELATEEQALTAARATLPPEEFRAQADAFDARVQRIRAERDDRLRALAAFRDGEQQRFLNAAVPVLTALLREEGAVAVIDRRALVLALDSIDITDRAIEAVDAALGDGAAGAPPADAPAPDTPQPPPAQDGGGGTDTAPGPPGKAGLAAGSDPGADNAGTGTGSGTGAAAGVGAGFDRGPDAGTAIIAPPQPVLTPSESPPATPAPLR